MRTTLRRLSAYVAVPVMAGAVTLTTASSAFASDKSERAIVVLTGGAVTAPGVRVLSHLPSMHLELVEASPYALHVLAGTYGVLGITRDTAVHFMGNDRDKPKNKDAVYASEGLGGGAGTEGAGAGVDIALIDTGVSDTAALNRASGRLVDELDTSGLVDGDTISDSGTFTDGFGHGTFMANLIAGGKVPGSKHALGVAPGARVHVVKVADDQGNASLFSLLVGLNWVATRADTISVANLAFGTDRPMDAYGPDPLNVATEWLRGAGVTVVVASGNTAGEVSDPGFAPGALTVGAADLTSRHASVAPFSGAGTVAGIQKPDLVASGVSLLSLVDPDSLIATQHPESRTSAGLYRGSGTSESTAVVTGLAALFVAAHPDASTTDVKSSLRSAASRLDDDRAGQGLARAAGAISDRAGDGEEGFNPDVWRAGALAGDGFTADEWMADLGASWFGDASVAADWASARWSSARWSSARWSAADWSSTRWRSARWSTADWASAKWRSARWSSSSWTSARWSSTRWRSARWSSVRWSSVRWSGTSS